MYRLGKQIHKHRRSRKLVSVIVPVIILGLVVYWLMNLRITPEQDIRNAPPVSKRFNASEEAKVQIDKPEFTMELPAGWSERPTVASPTGPRYVFSAKTGEAKVLDVYIDNPPVNLAINKAIVVSAEGNTLAHESVSENCVTFTDPKSKNVQNNTAPARWQQMDFICEMGMASRQVVGTISHDGINQVVTTGASGTQRKVFMTYTDNDITPNYSILYAILESIRFK